MPSAAVNVWAVPLLAFGLVGCDSKTTQPDEQPPPTQTTSTPPDGDANEWHRVQREGSVNIREEYDLTGLLVPEEEIHTLLERDDIPSLTDPKLEPASEADWLTDDDRIIVISINGETVGAPLRVLTFHEVINITVGGEPVAATFCPLCDSATLISRRVTRSDTQGNETTDVLEFGVSGALYNSNVIMYDRTDKGLWSQLAMRAISGPLAGTHLEHLPLDLVPFSTFKAEHPSANVVSNETGYDRPYTDEAYTWVFESEDTLVPVAQYGDELPAKTQGIGLLVNGFALFVPGSSIPASPESGLTVKTPAGEVRLARTGDGPSMTIRVVSSPEGVMTAQTFYYAWSAFNPETVVYR